jgi:general secretion pathway protein D
MRPATLGFVALGLVAPIGQVAAWPAASRAAVTLASARGDGVPVVVRGVGSTDTLNVRSRPNPRSAVVTRLSPDARDVLATGRTRRQGSSNWREIHHLGVTGWVNGRFLSAGPVPSQAPPVAAGVAETRKPPAAAGLATAGAAADSSPAPVTLASVMAAVEKRSSAVPSPRPPPVRPAGSEPAAPGKISDGRRRPGAAADRAVTEQKEYPGEKQFNQCQKIPAGKAILKLTLKPDTDIADLVGWISSITCTPILLSNTATLSGKKVTVISPQPISLAEAYRLFYAALESVGLTVEPSGRFLRIVDVSKAHLARLPYYGANDAIPADKRFITKLLRVDNLDASDLVSTVLNRIKSESGDIISYRSALIITDTAENVERMAQIIKDFDVPSALAESLWMIRIKNMSASEMASRLAQVVPVQQAAASGRRVAGAPGAATPVAAKAGGQWSPPGDLDAEMTINKIVPDERSNSLLVVANRRAYDWLITLVRKLDQPIEGSSGNGNGRVHVYYCENASCDELAATLGAVAGVQVAGTASPRRPRSSTPGSPGFAPPMAMAPPSGDAANRGAATSLLMFEGEVRITFDPPTNSLLIVSSFRDFQVLRKVIEKLDGPRKQVFIEATILEVLLDKTRELGVSYHGGKPVGLPGNESGLLLGGFEASKTLSPASLISSLGGLTGALFGPQLPAQNLQLFGTSLQLPSFGVFLQLLQTNNDVNVLSNPSLLITNNQEGEISVGENLPFPGQLAGGFPGALPGQQGPGGFAAFPSVGVQRQNVALTMKITPSVNEHNMIRLDVDQVIEDVAAPNFNGLGPATSKRSAKTQIVARDQQTVVIGGLMTDRASETVRKVPILGDIPVLGFFFRSTTKITKKANIVIALTPYVISDLSDLRRIAEKKLRERREFIERYSSLEDKERVSQEIDYRHTRGMLEEINRAGREVEEEEAELRRIRASDEVEASTELQPPGRSGPMRGVVRPSVAAQVAVGAGAGDAPAAAGPAAPPTLPPGSASGATSSAPPGGR